MSEMNREEHIERHKMLHRHFDELVADFMTHTKKGISNTTVVELIKWSYSQTINPTTCED
jgi:hypothetical protein